MICCSVCGAQLGGSYLINSWNEPYCRQHQDTLPRCYSCHRLVWLRNGGSGISYKDGRTMCGRCRASVIATEAAGRTAVDAVCRSLARHGLRLDRAVPVQFADQQELRRRSSRPYARSPAGVAALSYASGIRHQRSVDAIVILGGLPRDHFAAIAAHELGHVWLWLHGYPPMPAVVEEGLCGLWQHLWLRGLDTIEARYRLMLAERNPDPVYGDGLRLARRAEVRYGLPAVLDYVRRYARLPG